MGRRFSDGSIGVRGPGRGRGVHSLSDQFERQQAATWPATDAAFTGAPWQRPADWLAMPEVLSTDNKVVGLLAVTNDDSNFVSLSASGAYTVDWGDGTVENVISGAQRDHQYTYSSISAATESTRGYRQVLVTVTPQGASWLAINILLRHASLSVACAPKWLDVVIAGSTLTSITTGGTSPVRLRWLERVRILSSAKTSWANQFSSLFSLREVEVNTTATLTSTSNMFLNCSSLTAVPLFNTATVTNMNSMFSGCSSLLSVPLFNTAAATGMSSTFQSCSSLTAVPLFNTAAVTNMNGMFLGCASLTTVPLFNTAAVQNMGSMFQSCTSLTAVPLFNTTAVTNMIQMFSYCYALATVPLFNTAAVTSMSNMFNTCSSLTAVPLFNAVAVTSMDTMFQSCSSLGAVPLFSTAAVTSMSTMFNSCESLRAVPAFNTAAVTNMSNMFNGCPALSSVGPLNAAAVLTGNTSSMFSSCFNLSSNATTGLRFAVSYASCLLSTAGVESVFTNLGTASGAQTVTITGNYGAPTPVSLSGTTVLGSTTVLMASTTGLATGMEVSGTGISTAVAVTLQDTGDTVTRVAHGLVDGTRVSFATIVTTTGIVAFTPYYVVGATADTFQVSDTLAGSAKSLTTNGSGTLLYGTTITAIVANTSITLSVPASATGTVTTSSAVLKRSIARLKGWTVSG